MLEVYIDGACEPVNPSGTASYGVIVLRKDEAEPVSIQGRGALYKTKDVVVWKECKVVGSGSKMSNNVAEYAGLVAFLKWLLGNLNIMDETITIFSDSQLLVNQMNGKWKAKKGLYVPYHQMAVRYFRLVGPGTPIEFKWIPRDANTLADALSVKALTEVGIYRRK